MTVPGKGGRPRKWRTDADRVRAFRARQRGEEEPASLDVALNDGDALALALARIDHLEASVVQARRREAELNTELAAARQRSEAATRRADRATARVAALQQQHAEVGAELSAAQAGLRSVSDENAELRRRLQERDTAPPVRPPNRAERRRAAKRERRRE